MHSKTKKKLLKIIEFLKTLDEPIHQRGLANAVGMHTQTIAYLLDSYLYYIVNVKMIDQYGFKAKLISLKPDKRNVTLNDIIRYWKVKKKIRS